VTRRDARWAALFDVTACHGWSRTLSGVSHLRIQVLGRLAVWHVGDDGLWQPIKIEAGAGSPGLLALLIFLGEEVEEWKQVTPWLWDRNEIARAPAKYDDCRRQVARRLRKALLRCGRKVLADGHPELIGRGFEEGPRTVHIDWDDFQRYQENKEHDKALSLVTAKPLPEINDNDERIGPLLTAIRYDIIEPAVEKSLRALKRPIPDPLELGPALLSDFEHARPPEWQRVLAPTATGERDRSAANIAGRRREQRPPPRFGSFPAEELFVPCTKGEARLAREQEEAKAENGRMWWSDGLWLGAYHAHWFKLLTTPCEEIAIVYTDELYDAARFDAPAVDAPKEKATILQASSMLGDNPAKQIVCGRTNWGVAHEWAKEHAAEILDHPSKPSVYGRIGRPAYPGIAGVHVLAQTSDGYILFAQRSDEVDFHRLTWSASFEESVATQVREFTGPLTGDGHLLHVIEAGLFEEWGIEEDAIIDSTCLAIGREWVQEQHDTPSLLNLSSTVLTACRLNLTLRDVWHSLDESGAIRDRSEHQSWAGCRFASRDDVLRFVVAARGKASSINLLAELAGRPEVQAKIEFYPGGIVGHAPDLGLMPTAAARLVLGSAWLSTLDSAR
jgi:hypothetical protein